jgi:ABC-type Fe3+-hydroxamate transport system substrate-binding protein
VAKRPAWSSINAVARDQVIGVPDIEASYWGPQIVDFMQTMANYIKTIARG